jgi:hypothetical protein
MAYPERETVIVDRGSSGAGVIVGIIVVLALLGIGYLMFANNAGAPAGGTVDIDVPAVSVDVVPDGQ